MKEQEKNGKILWIVGVIVVVGIIITILVLRSENGNEGAVELNSDNIAVEVANTTEEDETTSSGGYDEWFATSKPRVTTSKAKKTTAAETTDKPEVVWVETTAPLPIEKVAPDVYTLPQEDRDAVNIVEEDPEKFKALVSSAEKKAAENKDPSETTKKPAQTTAPAATKKPTQTTAERTIPTIPGVGFQSGVAKGELIQLEPWDGEYAD
jgi:hypothetical protein